MCEQSRKSAIFFSTYSLRYQQRFDRPGRKSPMHKWTVNQYDPTVVDNDLLKSFLRFRNELAGREVILCEASIAICCDRLEVSISNAEHLTASIRQTQYF